MISQAEKQVGAPVSPKAGAEAAPRSWERWLPLVFAAGVLALYAPTLTDAAHQWMSNDNYAHGIFVFPLCAFLLWLRRDDLRQVERRPSAWGLLPLACGLLLECLSYIIQLKYVGMWTLALTLIGGALLLYGPAMLRIVRFAILFSLLANPLPHTILNGITLWIQNASTVGAFGLMHALGYPLIKQGNVIEVPGAMLEVALACSGFHKLLSLSAFTLLYSLSVYDQPGQAAGADRRRASAGAAGQRAANLRADRRGVERWPQRAPCGARRGGILRYRAGVRTAHFAGKDIGMSNNAFLPVICCAMVLSAVGADYGLGQLDVSKSHRLPVETFPTQLGSWQGGPVREVDSDVQSQLKTAKIVERVYRNPSGESVDLMLLTATEDEDMHSPQTCFPSQGYTLSNVHSLEINGEPATQMNAQISDGPRQTILYWLTGYYPPSPPRNALLRHAAALRPHLTLNHNNMSLFVRIIADDTPLGHRALADFMGSLHGPLQQLIGPGAVPVSKDKLHRGLLAMRWLHALRWLLALRWILA